MSKIAIKDWHEWQSFRKDRGTPPWIKIHRNLLSNKKWAALSDSEKGQLVSMWMVAADDDGQLPDDPTVIRKICQLDEAPDLLKFKTLGFMTTTCQPDDNQMTTTCQPDDAPEKSRVEKSRVEKSRVEKKETPKGVKKEFSISDVEDLIGEHGLDVEKVKLKLASFREYNSDKPYKNPLRAFRDWIRRDIEKLKKQPERSSAAEEHRAYLAEYEELMRGCL